MHVGMNQSDTIFQRVPKTKQNKLKDTKQNSNLLTRMKMISYQTTHSFSLFISLCVLFYGFFFPAKMHAWSFFCKMFTTYHFSIPHHFIFPLCHYQVSHGCSFPCTMGSPVLADERCDGGVSQGAQTNHVCQGKFSVTLLFVLVWISVKRWVELKRLSVF